MICCNGQSNKFLRDLREWKDIFNSQKSTAKDEFVMLKNIFCLGFCKTIVKKTFACAFGLIKL